MIVVKSFINQKPLVINACINQKPVVHVLALPCSLSKTLVALSPPSPLHDTPTDTPQAAKVYRLLSGSHFAVLTHAAAPGGQNAKEAITWGLHVGFSISPFEMLGRPVFELCLLPALTNKR